MGITIALDAMGGDFAPQEIVKGAMEAVSSCGDIHIILVGEENTLKEMLKGVDDTLPLSILPASQRINSTEEPLSAVRNKPDSSLLVGMRAVKEGKAQALVTAGHTGAVLLAACVYLGRLEGIERPALAALLPSLSGRCLVLDVGANVDCKPEHLFQFALMGSIYSSYVLHIDNPRVGLLNIGEEAEKGNALTKSAYRLLEQAPFINFIGNVEGKDIFEGKVDVVVCDGFTGNIVLKSNEGLAQLVLHWIKELGWNVEKLLPYLDYTEYGGAPLLGIPFVLIKSHGRSRAKAIKQAILIAKEAVEMEMVDKLSQALRKASIPRKERRE